MIWRVRFRIQSWISRLAERCGVGFLSVFEPGRQYVIRPTEHGCELFVIRPDRPHGCRRQYGAIVRSTEEALRLCREWIELERIAGKEVRR